MQALVRTIWFATWAGLIVTSVVIAQSSADVVTVDPLAIEIRAVKDHSTASATFYVTPNQDLDTVTLDTSDLKDTRTLPTTQPKIPASQITFSTSNLQNPVPGRRYQVQVSVNSITQAGEWSGEITLQWTGTVTGELSIPLTVTMETVPSLAVKSPGKIVIRDTRGATTEERSVTIEEGTGGSPASGLSLLSQDLLNEDQSEVLPQAAISARFEPLGTVSATGQLPGGGKGYAIVSLNLDTAPSGHYAGELVLQSDNAADLPIPIEVDVKDPPCWPAFIMILGVIIGLVLTWYRSSVMPKDKVRVRIQVLNGHLEQDPEFDMFCGRQKVRVEIGLAEDYLRQDLPAEASSAIRRAETVWENWRPNRKALLDNISAAAELLQKLDQEPGDPGQQLPAIAAIQDQIRIVLEQQIPQHVDKPQNLWDLIFKSDTGWEPVLEKALAVCENLRTLITSLQAASQGTRVLDAVDLKQLGADLVKVEAQVKALTTISSVSQLDPIQDSLRRLHQQLATSSAAAAEAQERYRAFRGQAEDSLGRIEGQLVSGEDHVVKAIEMIKGFGIAQADHQARSRFWKDASRLAQNSLRAVDACRFVDRSAREIRQGHSGGGWDAVIEAEKALIHRLTDSTHYDLDTRAFFNELVEPAATLRATVESGSGQTFRLDWQDLPDSRSEDLKEAARQQVGELVEVAGLHVPHPGSPGPGVSTTGARLFEFWKANWWTASRRLLAANIATFVIGVGLLVFVGFKELYTDVPTFGVGGGWDYFKLFVWGFGAEAGRAQVVGLVKGWGIITPRAD